MMTWLSRFLQVSSLICPDIFCSSTLANMFPDLDKELIDDVVRMKQGR